TDGLFGLQLVDPIREDDCRTVVGLASWAILALGQEGTNLVAFFGDVKMAARPRHLAASPVLLEPPASGVDEVALSDPTSFFDPANFDFHQIVGFQRTLAVGGRLDFPAVYGLDHSRHDMGGLYFQLFG